jgi:hypothetical protein
MTLGTFLRQASSLSDNACIVSSEYSFARDVAISLVDEYSDLVSRLSQSAESPVSIEYAYERLLGVRGTLCRICPSHFMSLLDSDTVERWRTAESSLCGYMNGLSKDDLVYETARRVEERWTLNVERFLRVTAAKTLDGEIRDQLGLLRGIDAIALHLAQRELFHWSDYFNVSSGNAQALKLRIRLFSLFVATQRVEFGSAYKAIKNYRETFGISDRLAYPWWFVDCDLTERQMNWTYRRLNDESLGWRFQ